VEETRQTFTQPAYLLGELLAKEKKLAKRCQKLGVEAPKVIIIRQFVQRSTNELGVEKFEPMFEYEVVGVSPVLAGGWQIVASVQHTDIGNIVKVAPKFQEIFTQNLFNAPDTCEHCNKNRNRKLTIVVQDAEGKMFRVGTDCLKDFTGHNLPAVWETFEDDVDLENLGGGGERVYDLTQVITLAYATQRLRGWKGAQSEFGTPTYEVVQSALTKCTCVRQTWGLAGDCPRCVIVPNDADLEKAGKAIEWIAQTTEETGYIANLRVAVMTLAFKKNFPLIVSLIRGYDNFVDGEAQKKIWEAEKKLRDEAKALEVKVPCPNGKETIVGEIVKLDVSENAYGVRQVMTVKDARGFKVWGTVPTALTDAEVGDKVQFNAEVTRSDKDECFGFFKRPTKPLLNGVKPVVAKCWQRGCPCANCVAGRASGLLAPIEEEVLVDATDGDEDF
jgi:hypothetical protein